MPPLHIKHQKALEKAQQVFDPSASAARARVIEGGTTPEEEAAIRSLHIDPPPWEPGSLYQVKREAAEAGVDIEDPDKLASFREGWLAAKEEDFEGDYTLEDEVDEIEDEVVEESPELGEKYARFTEDQKASIPKVSLKVNKAGRSAADKKDKKDKKDKGYVGDGKANERIFGSASEVIEGYIWTGDDTPSWRPPKKRR